MSGCPGGERSGRWRRKRSFRWRFPVRSAAHQGSVRQKKGEEKRWGPYRRPTVHHAYDGKSEEKTEVLINNVKLIVRSEKMLSESASFFCENECRPHDSARQSLQPQDYSLNNAAAAARAAARAVAAAARSPRRVGGRLRRQGAHGREEPGL